MLRVMKALRGAARVTILLPQEGRFAELLREEGFEPIFLPLAPLRRRNPLPYLRSLGRLVSVIRRNRIDLVHSSGAYPNQHGTPAARLSGRRAICSLHTTVYRPVELQRNFVPYAHRVLAISEAVGGCAAAAVSPDKIHVRYFGVDLTRFRNLGPGIEVRRRLGIPEDALVVGQISQLIPRKRVVDLLRACAMLRERHPRLFILIVGEDHNGTSHRTEIEGTIRSLGLGNRTLLTGYRKEIDQIHAALDLLVLPSMAEGLGLVLLDAMAASKPVVASRIRGVTEAVVHGETGLLFPPGDVGHLAAAIDRLMTHPEERERMGRAGRARVERYFDGAACMERVARDFLDLLPNRGRPLRSNQP